MTTQREIKRAATFGDYQSMLTIGKRSFLGIGGTPAESRRLAIEAAELKLETEIHLLRDVVMITEPTEKAWSTKHGND